MIEMHRWLNLASICRLGLFQNAFHLFVAQARQSRERRSKLCPGEYRANGLDPDRRSLKPPRTIEQIIRVTRCVALRAFCDFFYEITPPSGLGLASSGREILCSAYDN